MANYSHLFFFVCKRKSKYNFRRMSTCFAENYVYTYFIVEKIDKGSVKDEEKLYCCNCFDCLV